MNILQMSAGLLLNTAMLTQDEGFHEIVYHKSYKNGNHTEKSCVSCKVVRDFSHLDKEATYLLERL